MSEVELITTNKVEQSLQVEARKQLRALYINTIKHLTKKIKSEEAVPTDISNAIKLLKDNDVVLNSFKAADKLEGLEQAIHAYDNNVVNYISDFKN